MKIYFRCPFLIKTYHFMIAIMNAAITFMVYLMFARATFTDPGAFPKGIFKNLYDKL